MPLESLGCNSSGSDNDSGSYFYGTTLLDLRSLVLNVTISSSLFELSCSNLSLNHQDSFISSYSSQSSSSYRWFELKFSLSLFMDQLFDSLSSVSTGMVPSASVLWKVKHLSDLFQLTSFYRFQVESVICSLDSSPLILFQSACNSFYIQLQLSSLAHLSGESLGTCILSIWDAQLQLSLRKS